MITDASNFQPLLPPRLVPATSATKLDGPGTRFRAGQLVNEPIEDRLAAVLQLAARKR